MRFGIINLVCGAACASVESTEYRCPEPADANRLYSTPKQDAQRRKRRVWLGCFVVEQLSHLTTLMSWRDPRA
jgi:hypothetical protein